MADPGVPRDRALLECQVEVTGVHEVLRAGVQGRGGLLVVEGALGSGKTAILSEAHARGRDLGMQLLRARSSELEREFPLGVVRQLFDAAVAAMGEEGREQALAGAAAGVAPLFDG